MASPVASILAHQATSPPLVAALAYAGRGWSVIPVSRDKRPLVAWAGFQKRRASESEIRAWYSQWPDAGVAIVCGAISGDLVVLDVDPRHGGSDSLDALVELHGQLPPSPVAKTGGGGTHYYFRAPGLGCIPSLRSGLDLKGDGGYVVAPPSLHPSGLRYEWLYPRDGASQLPALPNWIASRQDGHRATPERRPGLLPPGGAWGRLGQTIPDGQRNETLTRIAGWLHRYHPLPVVEVLLLAINDARCVPPLPREDVLRIAASIDRYPTTGTPGHPLAVVPSFKREGGNAP